MDFGEEKVFLSKTQNANGLKGKSNLSDYNQMGGKIWIEKMPHMKLKEENHKAGKLYYFQTDKISKSRM